MGKRVYKDNIGDLGTPIDQWVAENLRYDSDPYVNRDGIEDRIQRGEQAFSKLIRVLSEKGLITDQEVFAIVEHEYNKTLRIVSK